MKTFMLVVGLISHGFYGGDNREDFVADRGLSLDDCLLAMGEIKYVQTFDGQFVRVNESDRVNCVEER